MAFLAVNPAKAAGIRDFLHGIRRKKINAAIRQIYACSVRFRGRYDPFSRLFFACYEISCGHARVTRKFICFMDLRDFPGANRTGVLTKK